MLNLINFNFHNFVLYLCYSLLFCSLQIEEVLCTTSALHSDISAPLTNADWSTVALILLGFLQSGHIQGHERVIYLEGTRWHWVANVVTDLDLVHQTLVQSLSESGNKLFPYVLYSTCL